MANAVKRVLRKIRRKPPPQQPRPEKPWEKAMALAKAEEYKRAFWERDKKINRDAAFQKALLALAEFRQRQQAEKERQTEIAEQRLKNLKKARRKLAKIRSEQ